MKETEEPGGAKVKMSTKEKWLRIARERIALKAKLVEEAVDVVRDEVGTKGVEVCDKIVRGPKSEVESPVKVKVNKKKVRPNESLVKGRKLRCSLVETLQVKSRLYWILSCLY